VKSFQFISTTTNDVVLIRPQPLVKLINQVSVTDFSGFCCMLWAYALLKVVLHVFSPSVGYANFILFIYLFIIIIFVTRAFWCHGISTVGPDQP
jgi:hypothetical protein